VTTSRSVKYNFRNSAVHQVLFEGIYGFYIFYIIQGYCDVFLKCRAVDAEGPLARLKNLLFNKETLLTIAQWVSVRFQFLFVHSQSQ